MKLLLLVVLGGLLILVLVALLFIRLGWLPADFFEGEPKQFPYRRRDYLLSKAEMTFFRVLQQSIGDRFIIMSKVRLADLLFVADAGERRMSAQNRINAKHADFVLCDPQTLRPELVIELDDRSHDRDDRRERDAFVDQAMQAAQLPILHLRVKSSYVPSEIRKEIDKAMLLPK